MGHVVALHGFAGTGQTWLGALGAPGPDLPGHGSARDVRPADHPTAVERVLAGAPGRFALCGYSMGGRVALHVALTAPERVVRLVLVAATAGIEDEDERAERRAADAALADRIEAMAIDKLADEWCGQPLFADDPPAARALQRADVLRNEPAGLAAALRGLGAGASEPLWGRLGELTMPATVVVGERDRKYVEIGRALVEALPAARPLVIVPGAGHGVPREAPEAIAALL
jgi:2-succinyl-6-hydroxy-2,4-cyclohexadiene-1-carboxylate synthase